MNLKILVAIGFLFSSTLAIADGDSAKARGKQFMGAGIAITPLSDYVLAGGIEGYAQLWSWLQIGLTSLAGSKDLGDTNSVLDSTTKYTKNELSGSAIYLSSRIFIGNSFNVMLGVGQKSFTWEYRAESGTEYQEGKIEGSSTMTPFGLGHRWSYDSGFTIGCDWFIWMNAMDPKSKAETKGTLSGSTADSITEQYETDAKRFASQDSLTLLLTYLGWSF